MNTLLAKQTHCNPYLTCAIQIKHSLIGIAGKLHEANQPTESIAICDLQLSPFMSGMLCLLPADIISQVLLLELHVACSQAQPAADQMRSATLLGRTAELLTCCRGCRALQRSSHEQRPRNRLSRPGSLQFVHPNRPNHVQKHICMQHG